MNNLSRLFKMENSPGQIMNAKGVVAQWPEWTKPKDICYCFMLFVIEQSHTLYLTGLKC